MIPRAAFFHKLIESSSLPSKFGARYSTFIQTIVQSDDESNIDIDWENLGFNLIPTDFMYQTKSSENGHFKQGQLNPYGYIQLSPSAGVLNYGQGIFEGTKAYSRNDGRLFLFRPNQNAIRMQIGAQRMCMPCPSIDQFLDAVKQTALANKRFIPPHGKGSLYIRPLLIESGPILSLAPAPEYTFLVYACPVGNYFKEGTSSLNLYVEEDLHRASRGGAGGFSDVLYLDSINKKYIEEVSSCNIFLVKVEERLIEVDELNNIDEVFCTGTAVGIASVGSITYKGKRIEYKEKLTSKKLCSRLIEIQRGIIEDKRDWIVEILESFGRRY
ncbi:hypothetical protein R3W88_031146 [Solanum pinnatisectum]|uniref:Branched-chain-amino-acid aminotransferase n=1 Tax=Solanum pinnatisectum TaxID=50273 RepID=A0AAV9LNW1_9SOLN|nr:hypothetical protein R3W88_031146 [Solanum pinnatisectum]